MNKWWKMMLGTVLVASSLCAAFVPKVAIAEGMAADPPSVYHLTSSITVKVEGVLREQVTEGTRIGAAIRLSNEGAAAARIPDDELQIKTEDGIVYILRSSADNAKAIQPKEQADLNYFTVVDRHDRFSLSELLWVYTNRYTYPRQERLDLTVPIQSVVQEGEAAASDLSNPTANMAWGEPFTIPYTSGTLRYKPIGLYKQSTAQGSATTVTLLVENQGAVKQTIPPFLIDGKSSRKVFGGKRMEKDPVSLEPGEKQYLHYAIPTENDTQLTSISVLTEQSFTDNQQKSTTFKLEWLRMSLPESRSMAPETYELGKTIHVDTMEGLIPPNVDVAMVDLRNFQGEGGAFRTVVAKFKLVNRSDRQLPVPNIMAELVGSNGLAYMGSRQTVEAQNLIPNIGYVIYYTFVIPNSEKSSTLTVNLLDGQKSAPYFIPVASIAAQVQGETSDSALIFYPINATLKDWVIQNKYAQGTNTYDVKLNLDLQSSEAVVDKNFTRMKVELRNQQGELLGAEQIAFAGDKRLASGVRDITFTSDHFESPLILQIYESVDTAFGEAKRLVKSLRQ